jgi:hypothetical protein
MTLTRRDFLKHTGLLAGAAINLKPGLWRVPETAGRTLVLSAVYRSTKADSFIGSLAQDTVIAITASHDDWYMTPTGFIRRENIQPILPFQPAEPEQAMNFWAEMIAPVSVLREWCSGAAPIMARLGYGAVLYMIDRLRDDAGETWYGLADSPDGALIGWGYASHFARISEVSSTAHDLSVTLGSRQMVVYRGGQPIGVTPVYMPNLPAEVTTLHAVRPGGTLRSSESRIGAGWLMQTGSGTSLYSAYWHNFFGREAHPTAAIELPTFAGRWLYALLGNAAIPLEIKSQ